MLFGPSSAGWSCGGSCSGGLWGSVGGGEPELERKKDEMETER